MTRDFHKISLGEGFTLHVASTDKFKTTSLQLVLRRPLRADVHSSTAVIPFVLRRGTRRFPSSRDIARHLEDLYGAQFSADVGKVGETQNIELTLQVAHDKFLPEAAGLVEAAVDFLAEALTRPAQEEGVFRDEFVRQEAQTLRRRIERMINNSPQYALHRLQEEMGRDEPFGLHPYGDVDGLQRIEAGPLFRHYESVLATSPVDLFVVGPAAPDAVAQWVADRLRLPREDVLNVPPVAPGAPRRGIDSEGEPRVVVEEQPVQQGVLTLGYRTGVTYRDDDYPALLVYNGVLGSYPHSKLFVNVREKASLAYFATSRLEATKGVLFVAAGIAPENYERALAIVREQAAAVAGGDVGEDELDQTKKSLVNSLLSGRDSPGRIIGSRYIGIVNERVRDFQDTVAAIRDVTVEDVRRVAASMREDAVYFLRSPKTH